MEIYLRLSLLFLRELVTYSYAASTLICARMHPRESDAKPLVASSLYSKVEENTNLEDIIVFPGGRTKADSDGVRENRVDDGSVDGHHQLLW